jgi:cupin 2 domain-containing protein
LGPIFTDGWRLATDDCFLMNLFDIAALAGESEEVVDEIARLSGVRIERIVSRGQCSPAGFWYDQDHDEWVVVLQGEGVVGFEDGSQVRLCAGETLMVPEHVKHRVVSTSIEPPCIWIAIHGPGKV